MLIERHPIGIVARARAEYLGYAGNLGHHLAAQIAVREIVVADDVDLADLGFGPFGDFIDDIDAVLIQHHHLGLYRSGKPALALVQLDNPGHVGANLGAGENLPRGKLDLGRDLVFLETLVALKNDPVNDRVLLYLNRHSAIVVADLDVGEQLGRVEVFQGLIGRNLRIRLAQPQFDIRADRIGFEPLGAGHRD